MGKVKYSTFITSNGVIDHNLKINDSNVIEADFTPNFYTYLKLFDIQGRYDLYINDSEYKFTVPIINNNNDFILEDFQIQKFKLVNTGLSQITQDMIDNHSDMYKQDDLNKYTGFGSIQYMVAK